MRVPFTLLAGAVMATAAACSDYTGPGDPGTPPSATATVSVQDDQSLDRRYRSWWGAPSPGTGRAATSTT